MSRRGAIVWVTGLPSAGKSTFAARLADALDARGVATAWLDGDEVRRALVPPPGYDDASRDGFYRTLGNLANLLAGQGLVAIVAATAHRRAWRDAARAEAPRFVEVFVDVPAAECAARDPKGLWRAHATGGAPSLPDADRYEPPGAPDVIARGGEDDAALADVLARLG